MNKLVNGACKASKATNNAKVYMTCMARQAFLWKATCLYLQPTTHPKEKWSLGKKKKKVLKQIQGRVTLNIKVIKQNKEEKYQRLANEVSEQ